MSARITGRRDASPRCTPATRQARISGRRRTFYPIARHGCERRRSRRPSKSQPHYIGRPRRGAEFMTRSHAMLAGDTRCWPTRPRSANERIPDGGERILRQRSDQKSFCRLRQSRRALFGGFPAKQEAPERHIHARSNAQARHDRPKLGMACVSVRQRSSTV